MENITERTENCKVLSFGCKINIAAYSAYFECHSWFQNLPQCIQHVLRMLNTKVYLLVAAKGEIYYSFNLGHMRWEAKPGLQL
jgi:hypothetical protein